MTRFPEIWAALAAQWPPEEVKSRPGGSGKSLQYITARQAMNRLDEVLGPENWCDAYEETKDGLKCRLSVRVGDEWIVKEDGGGFATLGDDDDQEKSGYSSAFKRAAVKFGIGRYLYRDGMPNYIRHTLEVNAKPVSREPVRVAEPAKPIAPGEPNYVTELYKQTKALADYWGKICEENGIKETPIVNLFQIENHLGSWAITENLTTEETLSVSGKRSRSKQGVFLEKMYKKNPARFEKLVTDYLGEKLEAAFKTMNLTPTDETDGAHEAMDAISAGPAGVK